MHPIIKPKTKVTLTWTVEPTVEKTKLFNCIVSMDKRVNKEPGAFISKIYLDIEDKILLNELDNSNEKIKEFIRKYGNE